MPRPVNAGWWMCVCSPRTPGHHGRGTRTNALAGEGRFEHIAREMRHSSVNLMGRLTEYAGAAVGPARVRANHWHGTG